MLEESIFSYFPEKEQKGLYKLLWMVILDGAPNMQGGSKDVHYFDITLIFVFSTCQDSKDIGLYGVFVIC